MATVPEPAQTSASCFTTASYQGLAIAPNSAQVLQGAVAAVAGVVLGVDGGPVALENLATPV